MSKNYFTIIRAMLNSNGRTDEEAATFADKAEEMAKKHGFEHVFRDDINKAKAEAKARADAKAAKPKKGKAKAAKPKADKPVDNRMRAILSRNIDGNWTRIKTVTKADLKAALKDLRERGYTVKSKVIN